MTSPTNQEPLKKESTEIQDPSRIQEPSNTQEPKKKKNFLTSTFDELKLVVWPNKQPVSYTHLTLPTKRIV